MMVGTCQGQQQGAGSSSSITALPAPSEPGVRLAVAGGEIVAVMPFEGYITPEAAAVIRQKLAKALQAGEAGGVVAPCGCTWAKEFLGHKCACSTAVLAARVPDAGLAQVTVKTASPSCVCMAVWCNTAWLLCSMLGSRFLCFAQLSSCHVVAAAPQMASNWRLMRQRGSSVLHSMARSTPYRPG